MAYVTLSADIDMHNVPVWYGQVLEETPTSIVIQSGIDEGIYTGNFTYDNSGNVYGTLTGYEAIISGTPVATVTGADVSANLAEQLIQSGQIQTFLATALAGNDQFNASPGNHVIDGYGGYNTVYEPAAFSSYSLSNADGVEFVNSSNSADQLYNIQGIYFSDGFYDVQGQAFFPYNPQNGFNAWDVTAGGSPSENPETYGGPVAGLQYEYINVTPDNLNVSVSTDNWFIHTGSGDDAIAVHGGTNVLDGGSGSNFLTGGYGSDTFFIDDRAAASDIWSTVVNFHAGDAATIWGVSPASFTLSWADGQGATGYTGLTLHATAAGHPTASLTLAGFGSQDLSDGRLSVTFGTDPASGSNYMYIHANS